jgi:hypothetical protein
MIPEAGELIIGGHQEKFYGMGEIPPAIVFEGDLSDRSGPKIFTQDDLQSCGILTINFLDFMKIAFCPFIM